MSISFKNFVHISVGGWVIGEPMLCAVHVVCCGFIPLINMGWSWLILVVRHKNICNMYNCMADYYKVCDARLYIPSLVKPMWPIDTIWWHRCRSSLAHVMACWQLAPSHYLNQCWLIISEVLWHSPEGNFIGNYQDIYSRYEFENYLFTITATSPKGPCINCR